jgi:integrase
MKRDLYKDEARFKSWKKTALSDDEISSKNIEFIYDCVSDLEQGKNIGKGSKKGARSYKRLNTVRTKMYFIARELEKKGIDDFRKTTEQAIFDIFDGMRKGKINGKKYKSTGDYTKIFKTCWHWWMKVNRKKGIEIKDITEDLDNSVEEPDFTLFSKEDLEKMRKNQLSEDQLICTFVFDSLVRAPTELLSILVKYITVENNVVWLYIPDEISKSIGRNVDLVYCGQEILKYIKEKNLGPDDYLFNFSPGDFNKRMQEAAEKTFGDKLSNPIAKGLYKNCTLYDLRHSGSVHFRRLAQQTKKIDIDTLRQRGGWTDFRMLNYYTKFIHLKGEIGKDNLLLQEDRTEMQNEISELKQRLENYDKYLGPLISMAEKNNRLFNGAKIKVMKVKDNDEE